MKPIKICGINDAGFAAAALDAGVAFLGFIFAKQSPRNVTPSVAKTIRETIKPSNHQTIKPLFVGVFVEQQIDEILEIARQIPLDVIQLHSPAYTEDDVKAAKASGYEVWRLDSHGAETSAADAILLDGAAAGVFGGTGRLADWSRIGELKRAGRRVVLAGGIGPANIAAALATHADIIDINSSLETSPGRKSIALLEELFDGLTV